MKKIAYVMAIIGWCGTDHTCEVCNKTLEDNAVVVCYREFNWLCLAHKVCFEKDNECKLPRFEKVKM
jgi:hypothetical protein